MSTYLARGGRRRRVLNDEARAAASLLVAGVGAEPSAAEAPRVVAALRTALEFELMRGHIDEITAEQQVAIVAAVGDRMRGTPGIAATVFGALGSSGVNIIAISQGSSERNISLVVTDRDAAEAVRAIHRAFRLETPS